MAKSPTSNTNLRESFSKSPIGVFDSGFGGLAILREIVKELPAYDYVYLGDTARAPYGSRSQEIVYKFTKQGVTFLFEQGCQLIILACNTASSEALRRIQQEFLPKHFPQRKVLGVITPAVEEAIVKTKNNRIGVIATEGTVKSGAFQKEIKKLNPKIKVFQKACPLLVPIIEAGEQRSRAAELILENYLNPLIKKGIDTLILGCTHYGLLEQKIRKIMNREIRIISEGPLIARKLKDYLERHPEIEKTLSKNSQIRFLTTDLGERFKILGSQFFGKEIKPEKIILE